MSISFPGSNELFKAQKKGSKGLRSAARKNLQEESLMPPDRIFEAFDRISGTADPLAKVKETVFKSYSMESYHDWLWKLQLNFNLLLFGFGSKVRLLKSFCSECLAGEDVLSINGNSLTSSGGHKIVKALLDSICCKILHLPSETTSAFSSIQVYSEFLQDCLNSHYCRNFVESTPAPSKLKKISSISSAVDTLGQIRQSDASVNNDDYESESENEGSIASSTTKPVEIASSSFVKAYLGKDHSGIDNRAHAPYSGLLGKRKASNVQSLGHVFGGGTKVNEANSIAAPDNSWGKRYAHAKSRLYILVHSIDGEGLESSLCQGLLASLAACESISIIATVDKLNFQLLWNNLMLSQFRWAYIHTPTFESYPMTIKIGLGTGSKNMLTDHQAIEYIIKSLTPRHKDLLQELCLMTFNKRKAALATSSDGTAKTPQPLAVLGVVADGIPIGSLFKACFDRMIVRQMHELQQLLRELIDHRLVSIVCDEKKVDHVCIMLQDSIIRRLLNVGG